MGVNELLAGWVPRQEAMRLSGLDSNVLSRLDQQELVVPEKLPGKVVLYDDFQVLELRLIAQLNKRSIQWKTIRKILYSYRERSWTLSNYLLLADENIYWLNTPEQLNKYITELIASKTTLIFQVIILEGNS